MPSVKNILLTIGGPESVPGTAETREYVIPVRGMPDLDKTAERQIDPAIVGSNMDAGEYTVAEDVKGGIPIAFRPCGGVGQLLNSLLGQEGTPVEVGACIRIRYTGASASCKLTPSASGNTLNSKIGTLGSESNDAAFGTTGTIDLTASAFDTVTELVAAIEAYSNYECELVTGAGSVSTSEILDFTSPGNYRQAKNTWAYVWFGSSTSNVFKHEFAVDLSDTERPVYSIQKDGFQDNFLYDGCVVDRLSLSGALKAMVEADVDILGMKETGSQSASALTLEDVDPLLFWNGSTSVGGVDYPYVRNMSLEFRNNHMADGYGQGLVTRQYQQKAKFECTGELKLRLDANSFAERAKVFSNATVAVSLWLKGKVIAASIDELCIVEIPAAAVSAFKYEENNGVMDAGLSIKALSPKGTVYNDPVTVTILTLDTGAY
jgi:hypothetical protein